MALIFSANPSVVNKPVSTTTAKSTPAYASGGNYYNSSGSQVSNRITPNPSVVNKPVSTTTAKSTPAYASGGNYYNSSGSQVSNRITPNGGGFASALGSVTSALSRAASSGSSQLAGVYGASRGNSSANNGVSEAQNIVDSAPSGYLDSYKGSAGVSNTTYSNTSGSAISPDNSDVASARTKNRQIMSSAQSARDAAAARADEQKNIADSAAAALAAKEKERQDQQTDPAFIDEDYEQLKKNAEDANKSAQQANLEKEQSIKLSPEELAAQDQEDKYDAEEAMIKATTVKGIANFSDQPIATGFIAGQSASLQRQANADLGLIAARKIPLQQKLARLASQRAAASDVVRDNVASASKNKSDAADRVYDYRKEKRQNQFTLDRDDKQYTQERNKPITLSEGQTRYDPLTGKTIKGPAKTFAPKATPRPTAPKTFTKEVDGRIKMFDAAGNVIKDLGAAKTKSSDDSGISNPFR